jgi:hypothetical protein
MSSRAGNWLIIAGVLAMFAALAFLPAAFGPHAENVLAVAGCAFSMGALLISAGIYIKARFLPKAAATASVPEQPRKIRGGCDLCRNDIPIIHCRVHELHLCSTCMAEHYDARSCAFVPSTRGRNSQRARARGAS